MKTFWTGHIIAFPLNEPSPSSILMLGTTKMQVVLGICVMNHPQAWIRLPTTSYCTQAVRCFLTHSYIIRGWEVLHFHNEVCHDVANCGWGFVCQTYSIHCSIERSLLTPSYGSKLFASLEPVRENGCTASIVSMRPILHAFWRLLLPRLQHQPPLLRGEIKQWYISE